MNKAIAAACVLVIHRTTQVALTDHPPHFGVFAEAKAFLV